jgi:predicted O-methyltransferase YrrM
MLVERFVSVVQRRNLGIDESEAFLFPILEPLFRIETHMSFDERLCLFGLTWQLLPKGFVVCEVGSYYGASTAFMAAAASLKSGHVHAVDTWKNDAMGHEPIEDTYERFMANTSRFRDVITTHRGRAEQLSDQVPTVDLLFIDGDHSYENTKAHLMLYGPKTKPGGLLVLHDFGYETVRRAVQDSFAAGALLDLVAVESLKAFRLRA